MRQKGLSAWLKLVSIPIFLGIICLVIGMMGKSEVAPDGTLIEPLFFLIPLSYLLFLSGIILLLLLAIISMIKKINIIYRTIK